MTPEEHKIRHIALHKSLDELFADFIENAEGRTTNTILDLINWSHKQTIETDHGQGESYFGLGRLNG